jgi:hypothetical protein
MAYKGLRVAAAATLGLLVAACGGGGGDVGSTPAPPVTTNPPPTTSQQRFGALTAETRLDTSGFVINADDVVNVRSASSTATDAVVITFQPATGTYLVRTPFLGTTSFGAADADNGNAYLGNAFDYYAKTATVNGTTTATRLALYKPAGGSGGAVPLTYTTLLQVIKQTVPGGPSSTDFSWTFAGFATASADMPKTGSASYSGPAYAAYWRNSSNERETLDGSLNVTANFATGVLDTRILLNRFGYSTLSLAGAGTISGNLIDGSLDGKGYGSANFTGGYNGQFTGPGAAELGIRFNVNDGSAMIMGVGAARR